MSDKAKIIQIETRVLIIHFSFFFFFHLSEGKEWLRLNRVRFASRAVWPPK